MTATAFLYQDENTREISKTGESDSTSELVQDGETETNDGARDNVELEDNNVPTMTTTGIVQRRDN